MMKLYSQADFDQSRERSKKKMAQMLLCAAPFFLLSIVGFVIRNQVLCTASLIICGSLMIFLWDLKVSPARRYGKYLAEVHSGLTRETVGMFVRMGQDAVYMDGVDFYEMILNIYEDMSEEGERRFLVDAAKEIPSDWIGRDVVVTSHGSHVLAAVPAGEHE